MITEYPDLHMDEMESQKMLVVRLGPRVSYLFYAILVPREYRVSHNTLPTFVIFGFCGFYCTSSQHDVSANKLNKLFLRRNNSYTVGLELA